MVNILTRLIRYQSFVFVGLKQLHRRQNAQGADRMFRDRVVGTPFAGRMLREQTECLGTVQWEPLGYNRILCFCEVKVAISQTECLGSRQNIQGPCSGNSWAIIESVVVVRLKQLYRRQNDQGADRVLRDRVVGTSGL